MEWFWALLMKPAVMMVTSVFLIVFLIACKWIVWRLLPDGWLRDQLFRYRGKFDPQPPTGSGKYLLDDPTVRGGSLSKNGPRLRRIR